MDRLDRRLQSQELETQRLKEESKGKDMTIAKLEKDVKSRDERIEELEKDREHQIELNRSQGQKIARLTRALDEANKRIRQLEERLGDAG